MCLLRRCTGVNTHRANCLVASKTSGDPIDQTTLLTHFDEEARGHISAKHLADHHRRIVVHISIIGERKHHSQMFLLPLLMLQKNGAARMWFLYWRGISLTLPIAKEILHLLHNMLPVKFASDAE